MTLASRVASGAAWMVSLRFAVRGIGLVSTLLLVRLLAPADFGIVAMAMSIIAVIDLLTAFSFDVALIQKQDASPDEYNAAWTLNVLLGMGATAVLLLVAYPAARFYNEPKLTLVITALAACALFQGLGNIGLVDFRKHLEFHKEFLFQFTVKIAAFIVTVSLAFVYRSYWALVAGILAGKLTGLALGYVIHPFRPKPSLKAVHSILNFSKWLLLNNLAYFGRFRTPDFILGKLAGASGLGLFSVAYEISNLPTTELIAPINRALLPGFSKMNSDRKRMSRNLAHTAAVLALISIPAGFGIAATSELLVPVFLGEQWMPAIPLIRILALYGAINAVQSPIGTALLAAGRPGVLASLSCGLVVVMIPTAIYFTRTEGPEGMAKALFATSLLFWPLLYGVASRILGLSPRDIVRVFARPLLGGILMYFAVEAFIGFAVRSGQDVSDAVLLAAAVAIGALVYSGVVGAAWLAAGRPGGPERYALQLVIERANRMALARRQEKRETGH